MSLLDSLARRLAGAGLGAYDPDAAVQSDDWSIFLEKVPQSPGLVLALFTYGSEEPDTLNPWDETYVQVRVRGDADPRTSRDKASAIYSHLHGLGMVTLPGGVWLQSAFARQADAVDIGPDANGRHEHVVNLAVEWDHPTEHRPAM